MHIHFKLQTLLAPLAAAALLTSACGDDTTGDDTGATPTTTDANTDSSGGDTMTNVDSGTDTDTNVDSGTDTNVDSGTDTADTDEPMGVCMTYCSLAMTNCSGDDAVYPGMDECMSACAAMPEGTEGDMDGDSAWCRAYHAGDPAAMDSATHCPHATAHGGTVCGSYCEAYCDQNMANCSGDDEAYPDRDSCMAACAAFPEDGAFNATDGNSVQCRVYHASFPAAGDAATHCSHTSSNGDGVCGDLCEGYCAQALANCGEIYADEAECMTACGMFPTDGDWNAVGGDSVQCRTYHASFPAATDGATHCAHAAPDGGGVCA